MAKMTFWKVLKVKIGMWAGWFFLPLLYLFPFYQSNRREIPSYPFSHSTVSKQCINKTQKSYHILLYYIISLLYNKSCTFGRTFSANPCVCIYFVTSWMVFISLQKPVKYDIFFLFIFLYIYLKIIYYNIFINKFLIFSK